MWKDNDLYFEEADRYPFKENDPDSIFYKGRGTNPAPAKIDDATETKSEAFHNLKFKGKQQEQVYNVILNADHPLTDREISHITGIERSTINARRNELLHRGLIEKGGQVIGEEGAKNETWKIKK